MARFRPTLGAVIMGVAALLSIEAKGANPLMVDGARPQRVVVLLPGTPWDDTLPELPGMARRLQGVLAVLEGDQVRGLFDSVIRPRPGGSTEPEPLFEVRLFGRASSTASLVRPRRDMPTRVVELENESGSVLLNRSEFQRALGLGALYRGDFGRPAEPIGVVFNVTVPPERIETLDTGTARERLFRASGAGGSSTLALDDERFAARLPKMFDPRDPPGLAVWCSPVDQWKVPQELHQALDAHNLIAIGALDAGNDRPVLDRAQLALDAAATAMSAWPIDTRRIYLVGMSGGAKVAVMLWAGWPEVFSGAVPIVGMASYRSEPAPGGGAYAPLFSRPTAANMRALKAHRLAPMTGPPDFNYDPVLKMARGLERDGLAVRVFEHADMAHTMPTPERFEEAIRWVDEPYQSLRRQETARAGSALAAAEPGDREALLEVMRVGPWTPAAWTAWERLTALPPAGRAP